MSLKLFLFGPPRIEQNGRPLELNLRKGQALLAYLAVEGKRGSRDDLAAMFWPDSNQSSARASLRRTLYHLNQTLESDLLQSTTETISITDDAALWLDTAAFQQNIACLPHESALPLPAGAPPAPNDTAVFQQDVANLKKDVGQPKDAAGFSKDVALPPACLTALTQAATLQRDPFLSGFSLPDCPQFDEWHFFRQEAFRQSLFKVLEALINHHTIHREYEPAIKYGRQWLELEPWHEPTHRSLMALYAQSNQVNLALHQYEQCHRLLYDEFGIEPEAETIELYEKINTKAWTPIPGTPIPGSPTPWASAAPPMLSVNGLLAVELPANGPPHNLPYQLTPFVGRIEELADLRLFIANPAVRLVSIIGPGGMGKTRLALALGQHYLAEEPGRFPDGIFHIALSPLTDSADILQTIAGALNVPLSEGDPSAALVQLQTILHPKKLLLILDNFEHLLDGAALVLEILQACPQVTILVTSRERLYLKEEHLLVIKGLDVPGSEESAETAPNEVNHYTSVKLFVQSVRRHRPAFDLTEKNARTVVHICRLLAGMPLALELAASWTDMLSLEELAEEIQDNLDILETELRNIPDRQRSIRAVFDTSWQRLQPAEQEICAQLSLFRGGFTRQTAQQIAITRDGRSASLQMLSRLADKSLIQYNSETRRYQVHELLRQYAAEQLDRMSDIKTAAEQRFHHYFAAFLNERRESITGPTQGDILRQITAELDNIRPVWRHSLNPPNLAIIQQSYYTLYQFGDFQGYFRENTSRLEKTIAALKTLPPSAERDETLAVLYTQLGYAYIRTGPLSSVEPACLESLSLFQSLGITPPPGFGTDPQACLGLLANILGRFPEAQQRAEEAIRVHDQPGHELNLTIAYYVLNEAVAAQGGYEEAYQYAQKAYHLAELAGNRWMMATILIQLGNISRALGRLDQARSYYQSSYNIKDTFNDPEGMGAALNNLGHIAWLQGDYSEAQNYFRRALSLYRGINDKGGVATSLNGLGETAVTLKDYPAARRHFREGLEIAAGIQYTTRLLALLTGVARLHLQTNHPHHAAQLLTLVRTHPAADRHLGDLVEELYRTYQEELEDEKVGAVDLTEMVAIVLENWYSHNQ